MPIKVITFLRNSPKGGVSPVHYYRAMMPVKRLGMEDDRFDVELTTQDDVKVLLQNGYGDYLLGRDIYVISRLYATDGREEFVAAVRNSGGKIVFDTDDDLTCDHRDLGRGAEFKEMLSDVDLVTVSTAYLAKKLEQYVGYKPVVLPNHIDFDWFERMSLGAKKRSDGIVVGMIGTTSHEGDWHYPVEALNRLAGEFKEVKIAVAGYMPPYLERDESVMRLNPVPYSMYPGLMRQFDIVCCSLDPDDEFNKSKSSIKAIEAMSAARILSNGTAGGAVAVCTNMPVYRRAVNHKNNGLLTDNEGWYETLRELVIDERLRNKIAISGLRWASVNRNIRTGYKKWGKVYRGLYGGKYGETHNH